MTTLIPRLGDPDDQSLKKYVVTLHNFDESDSFYKDMETVGGNLYIPDRVIECVDRLPISRNTNYMLTYDEAVTVQNDPRVLAVELNPEDSGLVKVTYGFDQYSVNFDKSVASDANDINWGLLRCLRTTDIKNWGSTSTINQIANIISDCSGRNVDVVIMDDGTPYPTVLEYQQNADGTGYTRMVEYNWFQHTPEVTGGAVGNYPYLTNRLQQHGGHTSGTVAGNTQGWARDANIYNNKYADASGIQYVRMFHRDKPVNPLTGVKNPTIMSNSWGWSTAALNTSNVSQITIRADTYYPTSGTADAYIWDSNVIQNIARLTNGLALPARDSATDADMIDAMNEGIIVVASAGNDYSYIDTPDGLDYNNMILRNGVIPTYIHRGASPGATWGVSENLRVICVGATGQHNEVSGSVYSSTGIEVDDYKAEFSNYGPRVDCYAPGSGIQSIWNSSGSTYDNTPATDPRVAALGLTDIINNNFKKCPGTSMSCPQVAGVMACLAEKYPRMTQADARAYIKNAMPYTVLSTNGGGSDNKDAGFTFNPASIKPMLFLQGTRVPSADIGGFYPTPFPETVNWYRPISGQVYPRRKIAQTGNAAATLSLSSDVSTVENGSTVTVALTTTNLPNNTLVQYIISAKLRTPPGVTYSTLAYSGVCSETMLIASLDTRPYTGNRIQTTGVAAAAVTSITNSILGIGTLAISTPAIPGGLEFTGSADDGRWTVPLMFNITYLGNTYNTIYVGTNSYITFGAGSSAYELLGEAMPALPKIMISAKDNSCQRIFYGHTGVPPNRTFRIRFEGAASPSGGINLIYEVVFYENNSNTIDVQIANNARWSATADGAMYPFSSADISVPLVGTLTVNNNAASLPITISSTNAYKMTVRLGIFPTPSVNIDVN